MSKRCNNGTLQGVMVHDSADVHCHLVLYLQFSAFWTNSSRKPKSDEKTQQTDYTDKTGVIIISLDNRQSCHVIPMQLH